MPSEDINVPVVDNPAGDMGDTEAVGTGGDQPAAEYEYVDTSEFADKYVKVKVDGEEVDVPFNEAIQGYQRQADYTRKTQELASQREQLQFAQTLQTALENNPQQTLEVLSRHYGVETAQRMVADAQSNANTGVTNVAPEPEFDDPLERRVWEMDQRIQQYEQERATDQLQREISRLQSTYDDFVPQEVVREALRRGTTDLEGTYKQIAFDKLRQRLATREEAQNVVASQNQQVVDAKRDAAFIEGGSSANAPTDSSAGSISSVADAWAAAKQQIGM
jgi:hypothetical protein